MGFYQKLKYCYYKKRSNHWYKKFKNCSLPYPYWSPKRDTFEWVRYDKDRKEFDVQSELFESLGDMACTGLTYHYKSHSYFRYKEGNKEVYKIRESHGHNFNEIVKAVYDYPETFSIPNDCLEEYSKQEIRYLKRVQNYLKLIGLKDFEISKEREEIAKKWDAISLKEKKNIVDKIKKMYYAKQEDKIIKKEKFLRYENSKAYLYADCFYMHIEKEKVLKSMLNGEKDYRVFRYCGSRVGKKYFLLDKEENYYALIEFIEEQKIKFKNLSEDKINYKVYGYKTFKEYKASLYKDFLEDARWYEEDFEENTEVLYAKFKIIEKF